MQSDTHSLHLRHEDTHATKNKQLSGGVKPSGSGVLAESGGGAVLNTAAAVTDFTTTFQFVAKTAHVGSNWADGDPFSSRGALMVAVLLDLLQAAVVFAVAWSEPKGLQL